MIPTVEIDDRQVQHFIRVSPKRAEWALREALAAAGGHLRKKIAGFIKRGGAGWPPLSAATIRMKRELAGQHKFHTKPLEIFARLVRFKVGKSKGALQVRVGFFNTKSWFKNYYGTGAATIASLHETGNRSSRHGRRPVRPMVGPVWQRERGKMPKYIEDKFFKNFFGGKRPDLRI